MEFLVEFEVNVPDEASATEVDARESAEASAAPLKPHPNDPAAPEAGDEPTPQCHNINPRRST